MEIKPKISLFGLKDVFKVGDVCIKADVGTAIVEKTKTGQLLLPEEKMSALKTAVVLI